MSHLHGQEKTGNLTVGDIYGLFNNYRVWRYLIGMLMMLGKVELSSCRILDACCGTGGNLNFFTRLRANPKNCHGFDSNEEVIALCKSLNPSSMNFWVGSPFDIPHEKDTFDIILCMNFLSRFQNDADVRRISEELRRVMRPDGVLLVLDPNEFFPNVCNGAEYERFRKDKRMFNTAKGEMEILLSPRFALFKRVNAFSSDIYYITHKYAVSPHHPADIADISLLDQAMDLGWYPCGYTLYSFTPKGEK